LDKTTQSQLARGKRPREILKQPQYSEIIKGDKKLSPEAETILKEAIAEYTKTFLASV
jgi:F-type H+-transporting ATPase subunit alpha